MVKFPYYFRKLEKIIPVITSVMKTGLQHGQVGNHGVGFALIPQWGNYVGETVVLMSTIC